MALGALKTTDPAKLEAACRQIANHERQFSSSERLHLVAAVLQALPSIAFEHTGDARQLLTQFAHALLEGPFEKSQRQALVKELSACRAVAETQGDDDLMLILCSFACKPALGAEASELNRKLQKWFAKGSWRNFIEQAYRAVASCMGERDVGASTSFLSGEGLYLLTGRLMFNGYAELAASVIIDTSRRREEHLKKALKGFRAVRKLQEGQQHVPGMLRELATRLYELSFEHQGKVWKFILTETDLLVRGPDRRELLLLLADKVESMLGLEKTARKMLLDCARDDKELFEMIKRRVPR